MATDPIQSAEAAADFIDKQLPPTWASGCQLTGDSIRAVVAELRRLQTENERLKAFNSYEGMPTDDPHWVFDFLVEKLPIWAEHFTGGPDEASECLKALKGIHDECFSLAANQCHRGYSADGGGHRCEYQDELRRLRTVTDEQAKRLGTLAQRLHAAGLPID